MSNVGLARQYDENYKEIAFTTWYSSGRGNRFKYLITILPPADETGRKPNAQLLSDWKTLYGWDERADVLDAKAQEKVDLELINKKADMLKRQAEVGFALQQKGIDHIKEKGFDSSASAVTAIFRGAELERSSLGMSEFMQKLSRMSNEDVLNEIIRLSSRAEVKGTVVNGEVKEEKEEENDPESEEE